MKRLKQLEEENQRLKRLVADLSLDKDMLRDVVRKKALKPARRRELIDYLRQVWQVSIRRACRVLKARRSTYHYKSRRPSQAALRKRIPEIAEPWVRYAQPQANIYAPPAGNRLTCLPADQGLRK